VSTRIAVNLRRIRKQNGWSTYELADELKRIGWPVDASAITKIENGNRGLTPDDLVALAVALGCTPGRLLLPNVMAAVEGDTEVAVAGNVTAGIWDLSAWMCGEKPLEPATGPEVTLFSVQNQPHRWRDAYGELDAALQTALKAGIPPAVLRDHIDGLVKP